ncbi:MAG: hypothetical protein IPN89_17785 [Saprospiraceae bacterium]|nr:hypothetical protein [Saprospiraceae bacterium]
MVLKHILINVIPLSANVITAIAVDKKGHKWFGTENNGIVQYDGQIWKSHILSTDLNANGATDVVADANDNIWVATNSGLKKYNGTVWTSYKKRLHRFCEEVYFG